MTAISLRKPLAEELGDLIARIDLLLCAGDVFTREELVDLKAWLRAARQRHWDELRQQRSKNWEAAIVRIKERPRGDMHQCDTEGAA